MILTCEKCHTRYLLPTHLLGVDGRRVRCTICSHEWFQVPEDEFDESSAEPISRYDSENSNVDEAELPLQTTEVARQEAKGLPGNALGLLAAILLGGILFAGLLLYREPVMRSWPDSIALYDALGLAEAVPGEGLVFENLSAKTSYNAEGVEILLVKGDVMNIRPYPVDVPGLRFSLKREDGSEAESWSYPSPNASILPEQSIPLEATYPQIAPDVKELNVRFVTE